MALDFQTGKKIYVAKDQIIFDNFFAAGEKVHIAGRIMGDLIVFGGEVIITGQIDGNIITFGGDVKLSGKAQNIFASGGTVLVNGIVKRDLLIGGGEIYITKNSRVGRDAYIGGGSANVAGKIYRNLRVGTGTLVISPNALVKGEIDYSSRYSNVSNKAKILGKVSYHPMPDYQEQAQKVFAGIVLTREIVGVITILLLGILAIFFFPHQVKLIRVAMQRDFWKNFGIGILSIILIPIVVILLFVTLVGFPLGVLLLVAYIFGIYFTTIFASIYIGHWIFKKMGKPNIHNVWSLIVGYIVFKVITWVPLIGWLFGLIVFFWAFGTLVTTRFVTYKEARERGVL